MPTDSESRDRFKFEAGQNRKAVAQHLRALADGLDKGQVSLEGKGGQISLEPADDVELRVEGKRESERSRLSVKINWSHRGSGSNNHNADPGILRVESGRTPSIAVDSYEGIARHFQMLVLQVTKQLERTEALVQSADTTLIKSIQDSDDYIDVLKSQIESGCFAYISRRREPDEKIVDFLRAVTVITSNLERIADFSANIAAQLGHLSDPAILEQFDCRAYFAALGEGVDYVNEALFQLDTSLAVRVCQIEARLDRLYHEDVKRIIERIRGLDQPHDLITAMFILHYMERMGDALLNIGEAVLFAVLGERLKIRQYHELEEALASVPQTEQSIDDVEIESIWGTRSGVRIGTVEDQEGEDADRKLLFKEGNTEKLERERDSLQRWAKIAPDVVPQIVSFKTGERGSMMLLEYIPGRTVQRIALESDETRLDQVLVCMERTLRRIWDDTLQREPVQGTFLHQLMARLEDVYRTHPRLRDKPVTVRGQSLPPLNELMERGLPLDAAVPAPFKAFMHGDFNLDNVLYDDTSDTIHFVDVHRSDYMDYVQDVSVFLVSGFRVPVFDDKARHNLEFLSYGFLEFARSFASEKDDATFDARLALGLVRSFITSTRFELNADFAHTMYGRGVWLLHEVIAAAGQPWEAFRLPDHVLRLNS